MKGASVVLWGALGIGVAAVYVLASRASVLDELESAREKVFVMGSCPYTQAVLDKRWEGRVVVPVDWDDAAMTMSLCAEITDSGLFALVPLRLQCEWVVDWARVETVSAPIFPAYQTEHGDFQSL